MARHLDRLLSCRSPIELILVYSNNQTVIFATKDPKYHNKLKHIDIKYNYVIDVVTHKVINLEYLPMDEMVVNLITKPLKWSLCGACKVCKTL